MDNSPLLVILSVLIGTAVGIRAIWWRLHRAAIHVSDGDSLVTSIVPESGLESVDVGPTPAGYSVKLLINDTHNDKTSRFYYIVTLPFISSTHLIGIPTDDASGLGYNVTSRNVSPVMLEGNYSSLFHLYVGNDDQEGARYVLDPAAMVFTIDFCQQFAWEIDGSTLYFAAVNEMAELALVDEFIRQIRPALSV